MTGVQTCALPISILTDMNAPLGRAIGNALEVIECFEILKGRGPEDVVDVVTRLAARMIVLAGLETDADIASTRARQALSSGRALETFTRMIACQGGNPAVAEDYSLLPAAPDRALYRAPRNGFVTAMRAEYLGRATNLLGAGRARAADPVDPAVGAMMLDRKSTRLNSSHMSESRMPSSA